MTSSVVNSENVHYIDEIYNRWVDDTESVSPGWAAFFADLSESPVSVSPGPSFKARSIFSGGTGAVGVMEAEWRQVRSSQLINAFRVRGHIEADIDPLNRRKKTLQPELSLAHYELDSDDLDAEVLSAPLFGVPAVMRLGEVIAHCRAAYSDSIGAEFMNIDHLEQKLWVEQKLETLPGREVLNRAQERRVLRKLSDAENFERLLHTRFPGTKRFSLEGGETLIPVLDLLISAFGQQGAREIVIGMSHRGRLNVMANVLEKPVKKIVDEFYDVGGDSDKSGDVKYHLGYSSDILTETGETVHVGLCFNPSHLEAVDPVVLGRVRSKQTRVDDVDRTLVAPILIHGDAAFAGQGVVAEVLQASELTGYSVGGTIHLIVNNQIGFTTQPKDARSTPYASGMARMLGVPIFHVNGEDPRAVAAVVQIAVEWRQTFHRDVVIDMLCYRKHGHNEGDEPSFTQPLLYGEIRKRFTPREMFAQYLVEKGHLTQADVNEIRELSRSEMERALELKQPDVGARDVLFSKAVDSDEHYEKDGAASVRVAKEGTTSPLKGMWAPFHAPDIRESAKTGVPIKTLVPLLRRLFTVPESVQLHAKIKRLLTQRLAMVSGERPMDWALAELAAYATLLVEGHGIRLSGQDVGRGTFSHRHAVLTDIQTGAEYVGLSHLAEEQGCFEVVNSFLSEEAVLGFEYGYSLDTPDSLVLWEAQFGDFANGAQVMIDQFVTTAEQKWSRYTGLVMLLPHGYAGQGPEHSSARPERYLQACANDNIQIANCTTPANYFHLLRRQQLRRVRKPLVVFTPKGLLRHPLATSSMEELEHGHFQSVIGEVDAVSSVRRVVLCSGRVYYELLQARREAKITDIALIRVELLHPFPAARMAEEINRYPADADLVWCQEEPQNMGAWPRFFHWFHQYLQVGRIPRYLGRPSAASPATGSHSRHLAERDAYLTAALSEGSEV